MNTYCFKHCTRVRGFNPGRSLWIFSDVVKILKHAFLRRGSKNMCPMSTDLRHVKEPSNLVNYGLLVKFLGLSSALR
jgi:hypothetical protein